MQMSSIESSREKRICTSLLMSIAPNVASSELLERSMTSSSKLDGDLARGLMSIGAVKAVEIGTGRECARLQGSEMNDSLLLRDGKVDFESNHAGGILGGISTGAPIVCTISVKPTPSIAKQQSTVDLARGEVAEIEIKGRHDPAIPPRIVPVAEAMVALVLADHLLCQRAARL